MNLYGLKIETDAKHTPCTQNHFYREHWYIDFKIQWKI